MKNPHFVLENGTIYLYDGEEMITGYRRLAFGVDFSRDTGYLMKYGEEERIKEWHADAVAKLVPVAPEWAARLVVLCQDNWQIEEIDKFINNSGYIGRWISKNLPELNAQ